MAAVYRESSAPRRKRDFATPDVKTEVFGAVGKKMSGAGDPERVQKLLRERFQSELVAVRRLLRKARPRSSPTAPDGKVSRQGFLAATATPRSEEPPAKKRKESPSPVTERAEASKKMTAAERELLAADLAELSGELPAHIIELLKKQSRGIYGDEMEIDIHAVQDAALVELKMQLDNFLGQRNPPSQERKDSKMADEEEEDVDICGGVSPLVVAPAPLQLAEEEDDFVDICGDASPVVMPKNLGGSPDSSGSSDSGSDSSSSDSDSESGESASSPAPAERAVRSQTPISELVARAKESLEGKRKEARAQAREKARQEMLDMERTAVSSETIQLLGIAPQDQYMVGPNSILRQLGLFLKDEDDGFKSIEEPQQQSLEEDLEEGELPF